jgi:hypothetical protein
LWSKEGGCSLLSQGAADGTSGGADLAFAIGLAAPPPADAIALGHGGVTLWTAGSLALRRVHVKAGAGLA